MWLALLFVGVVAYALYASIYLPMKYKAMCALPGPAALPMLGHVVAMRALLQPQESYMHLPEADRVAKTHHALNTNIFVRWLSTWKLFAVWFGPLLAVAVTSDPHTVRQLMGTQGPQTKAVELYRFIKPWLNTGLLTSNGAKWKQRRLLITPSFHFEILKRYYLSFSKHAALLADGFATRCGQPFHVYNQYCLAALDMVTETTVGKPIGALADGNSEYVQAVYTQLSCVFERIVQPWLWGSWYWLTPAGRTASASLRVLHTQAEEWIAQRRAHLVAEGALDQAGNGLRSRSQSQPMGCQTFLDVLLTAVDDDGKPVLSDADIREEVDTVLFEGHDTTAAALTWATYCIGTHPEVQRRVHEELDAVMGDTAVPPIDALDKLVYLTAAIKEALRCFPSVPFIARHSIAPTRIDDKIFPKGTTFVMPIIGVHHNEEYWENNWNFDPDRFLDGKQHTPFSFVPFSAGSRNCIGRNFALMEERVVLATIFKRFSVTVPVQQRIYLDPRLVLRPAGGKLLIQCHPR